MTNDKKELDAALTAASSISAAQLYKALADHYSHPDPKVRAAARYVRRRDRIEHPAGYWDKGGRWFPIDETEAKLLVGRFRSPSREWPYSYLLPARTLRHCCELEELPDGRGVLKIAQLFDDLLSRCPDRARAEG